MELIAPRTLADALAALAGSPEALPVAGGTDVLVELNFDRRRPAVILDISRLPELRRIDRDGEAVFLGAGVPFTAVMREFADHTALAQAARTVGSPQIRNRGTVGGNLGTASPAGDALPVLAAYDAEVILASVTGERRLPWSEFLLGPKRNGLAPGELIVGTSWRMPRGPGSFSKVGTRNAMVISMVGLCLQVDEDARAVRVALGSVAPTVIRAAGAETFAAAAMAESGAWDRPAAGLPASAIDRFGELVAVVASPVDDVRGTAAYRRHACAVLARRALTWALADRQVAEPSGAGPSGAEPSGAGRC